MGSQSLLQVPVIFNTDGSGFNFKISSFFFFCFFLFFSWCFEQHVEGSRPTGSSKGWGRATFANRAVASPSKTSPTAPQWGEWHRLGMAAVLSPESRWPEKSTAMKQVQDLSGKSTLRTRVKLSKPKVCVM